MILTFADVAYVGWSKIFDRFLQLFQHRLQTSKHLRNKWTFAILNILIFIHVRDCICLWELIYRWDKELYSVEWLLVLKWRRVWKREKVISKDYYCVWTLMNVVQFPLLLLLCLGVWMNYSFLRFFQVKSGKFWVNSNIHLLHFITWAAREK